MSEYVTVKTLRFHSLFGEAHDVGAIYDAPADQVDNLAGQGMAEPVNLEPPPVKASQPIEPMTTKDFGIRE